MLGGSEGTILRGALGKMESGVTGGWTDSQVVEQARTVLEFFGLVVVRHVICVGTPFLPRVDLFKLRMLDALRDEVFSGGVCI